MPIRFMNTPTLLVWVIDEYECERKKRVNELESVNFDGVDKMNKAYLDE